MKNKFILLVMLAIFTAQALAKGKMEKYAVGFYNLENLFDTIHDAGKQDSAFLPTGSYKWNTEKYQLKLKNLSKVKSMKLVMNFMMLNMQRKEKITF